MELENCFWANELNLHKTNLLTKMTKDVYKAVWTLNIYASTCE